MVRLENVRKVYRLYAKPSDRFAEWITGRPRHRPIPALDGVSLEVPQGSVLGLIGENGAGKSTLLKIVAGVTDPTSGVALVRGAVASILELGAGFHGEFTGRENARLNAAILGVPASRIEETLRRTLEFSELGHFFERPVRTYSSGMVMRLAFTVATEVDPEVLIIDEALAVGDGHFQKKSVDRIASFRQRGKTILFCTHAMYFITTLCDRAIWLAQGKVALDGEAPDVVREYESFLLEKNRPYAAEAAGGRGGEGRAGRAIGGASTSFPGATDAAPAGSEAPPDGAAPREAWIESARILDGSGKERGDFTPGEEVRIEIVAGVRDPNRGLHVRVGIDRIDDVQVFATDTRRDGLAPFRGALRHRIVYRMPSFPVRSGEFNVFLYLGDDHALHLYDHVLLRRALRVRKPDFDVGLIEVAREWSGEALP